MKMQIKLDLKRNSYPSETFAYFKAFEAFVYRRFEGVTNFNCEKKHENDYVAMSFDYEGYRLIQNDPEFKLFDQTIRLLIP